MKTAIIISMFLALTITSHAIAESGDKDRRHGSAQGKLVRPVKDKLYLDECGACHFAFQPELLPARSWQRMMLKLEDHFGSNAVLDKETNLKILNLLNAESGDFNPSKRAYKFIRSIKPNEAPLRITETRYFKDKHNEVEESTYKRASIGSPSNCIACHITADKGEYGDKFIKVPR